MSFDGIMKLLPVKILAIVFFIGSFVLPFGYVLLSSLFDTNFYTTSTEFTFKNYKRVLSGGAYHTFALRSVTISATVSLISLVVGGCAGFLISRFRFEWQLPALLLLTAPFFTGEIVRIISLRNFLTSSAGLGGSNQELLKSFGSIIDTQYGTILGLVQSWVTIPVLLIYLASIGENQKLLTLGRSLGAGSWQLFSRVFLPLVRRSIILSVVIVFIGSMGSHLASKFLGGPSGTVLAQSINDQYLQFTNFAFGSALMVTLLVIYIFTALMAYKVMGFKR